MFAFRRWLLRRSQVPFGLHPIRPWQAPPKRIGWRMAFHESRALLPTITVRAFIRCRTNMPSADFCCEIKAPWDAFSHDSATHSDLRGKFDCLPHATAKFTTSAFDGYRLRCHWPFRPAPYASDPLLVHRLVRLLHASFRPRLATTPLRFAMTSPPSGCQKDFHLRAVEYARHTKKRGLKHTLRTRKENPPLENSIEEKLIARELLTTEQCNCRKPVPKSNMETGSGLTT